MKKQTFLSAVLLTSLVALAGCGYDDSTIISVCASESPHAEILEDVVAPILEEQGYKLEVTVLDWTMQNDAVYNGDYDANYFQHRPYLQQYDGGSNNYDENYAYAKVFPTVGVHFEPLRVYEGNRTAEEFESIKSLSTTTYEICNDVSNEIRALDLLVSCGVIDSYEIDEDGNPIDSSLPSNIYLIAEEQLVQSKSDYSYAVLPANSALTGNVEVKESLPTETDDVASLRANVLAANVSRYASDNDYKARIDALSDALLTTDVADYIDETYNNVLTPVQEDYRA